MGQPIRGFESLSIRCEKLRDIYLSRSFFALIAKHRQPRLAEIAMAHGVGIALNTA